jgi:hypothetical protein
LGLAKLNATTGVCMTFDLPHSKLS